MTDTWAEQEARRLLGGCTCSVDYRRIRSSVNPSRTDPNCLWCNYGKDIATVLRRAEDRAYERAAAAVQTDDDDATCDGGGSCLGRYILANKILSLKSSAE